MVCTGFKEAKTFLKFFFFLKKNAGLGFRVPVTTFFSTENRDLSHSSRKDQLQGIYYRDNQTTKNISLQYYCSGLASTSFSEYCENTLSYVKCGHDCASEQLASSFESDSFELVR